MFSKIAYDYINSAPKQYRTVRSTKSSSEIQNRAAILQRTNVQFGSSADNNVFARDRAAIGTVNMEISLINNRENKCFDNNLWKTSIQKRHLCVVCYAYDIRVMLLL